MLSRIYYYYYDYLQEGSIWTYIIRFINYMNVESRKRMSQSNKKCYKS